MTDLAEESGHLCLRRSPRENCKRIGIREEKKIGIIDVQKPSYGCGVEAHSLLKCLGQGFGTDGDVLELSENVTECKLDEPHVLLFDESHDPVSGFVVHTVLRNGFHYTLF